MIIEKKSCAVKIKRLNQKLGLAILFNAWSLKVFLNCQGFGRWPTQYDPRKAAAASGDYCLNPICTHFLLPVKPIERKKDATAKFRANLEEYIRRGRFRNNKLGAFFSFLSEIKRNRKYGAVQVSYAIKFALKEGFFYSLLAYATICDFYLNLFKHF